MGIIIRKLRIRHSEKSQDVYLSVNPIPNPNITVTKLKTAINRIITNTPVRILILIMPIRSG